MIILKSPEEIQKIRNSCLIVRDILNTIAEMITPGVSTADLDRFAEEEVGKRGAKPAFKGYKGFPSTLCTSINDVVVHGIPSKKGVLAEGDIVSIDIGVVKEGFFGDGARTFAVGKVDLAAQKLLQVTREALDLAIKKVSKSNRLYDISAAIQKHVESHGFTVVRDFVGHGIGRDLHEDPALPNFGTAGMGPALAVGVVLAIEPMVNEGSAKVKIDKDGWTARTQDGKRSAHFEHSVALTENGPMVLTQ